MKRSEVTVAVASVTETPVVATGTLVVQEHGGALRQGGTNAGGPGAPPSLIRELCRKSFTERVHILEKIADGLVMVKVKAQGSETEVEVSPDVKDRLKAIDLLGKYGGIEKITVEVEPPPQMTETGEAMMHRLATEVMPRFASLLAKDARVAMLKQIEAAEIVQRKEKASVEQAAVGRGDNDPVAAFVRASAP